MACPRGCCESYRDHLRGIAIGGFPTDVTMTERKWDKDMDAFQRLTNDGLNPGRLDGAYVMERSAVHEKEIALGHPLPKGVNPDDITV